MDNLPAVKKNIQDRGLTADADAAVALFRRRNETATALQGLQQQRRAHAKTLQDQTDKTSRSRLIEEGKKLKERIAETEANLAEIESALETEVKRIPNMAHPAAPLGKEDKDNLEVKRVGTPRQFSFPPADHVKLGRDLDILDFEAGTKVAGVKFYYLKNEGVFLELGLIRYVFDILQKKGFTPFITPDIAKEEILEGIGFNPRGAESNIYTLDGEKTCLVGTAEITLGGYYAGAVFPKAQLPLRMAGLSHCFRREAGAPGQFSKGLYRVHQFTKVEMFVYCPAEESDQEHQNLRAVEEEIFSGLDIPFRVVDTCTGDLGAPAYRKWDLEAWMPGRNAGEWGEVTSTSNCTDYQARRLNIKYKDETGKNRFVHMLNGTAIAVSRGIIAILENFQEADGSVRLPPALVPYCGFTEIRRKS
jgi:seryl-tRNA synthetase